MIVIILLNVFVSSPIFITLIIILTLIFIFILIIINDIDEDGGVIIIIEDGPAEGGPANKGKEEEKEGGVAGGGAEWIAGAKAGIGRAEKKGIVKKDRMRKAGKAGKEEREERTEQSEQSGPKMGRKVIVSLAKKERKVMTRKRETGVSLVLVQSVDLRVKAREVDRLIVEVVGDCAVEVIVDLDELALDIESGVSGSATPLPAVRLLRLVFEFVVSRSEESLGLKDDWDDSDESLGVIPSPPLLQYPGGGVIVYIWLVFPPFQP
ncbi:hypothetical protein LENED_003754 [Lentinula edodes]|uniref:Uncharacterized protein n=1 Tax=Lentinula edodes TaxID=5353 RepID=A0A1Q3E4N3_LENED|nr:hypothetical protein LENED_003754 [Lentinula edodes]